MSPDVSLEILYQDEFLVVVNKPAGMLVHPGREPEPRDQIAMKVLRDQIGQRVTTLHRLDRPTSGALVFALEKCAGSEMRKLFDTQRVEKMYVAVVCGETPGIWTNETPLQKNDEEPARESATGFVRSRLGVIQGRKFSLLRAIPKTGRYHQIRRHLVQDGYPIIGDFLYGNHALMKQWETSIPNPGLMLHAEDLRFTHPVTEEFLIVKAPLPERFSCFREESSE